MAILRLLFDHHVQPSNGRRGFVDQTEDMKLTDNVHLHDTLDKWRDTKRQKRGILVINM